MSNLSRAKAIIIHALILLNYARKSCDPGLSESPERGDILVIIRTATGVGMSPLRKRIFHQLERCTYKEAGGSIPLSLSCVHGIIGSMTIRKPEQLTLCPLNPRYK
jgi:hypothetical protein